MWLNARLVRFTTRSMSSKSSRPHLDPNAANLRRFHRPFGHSGTIFAPASGLLRRAMMAVETNKGDVNVSPAQTLTGVAPGVGANLGPNGKARRKRPSSLMTAASSLPSVESSLDEFISRANQTLTDAHSWN